MESEFAIAGAGARLGLTSATLGTELVEVNWWEAARFDVGDLSGRPAV
jgi:hypothetical protein